MKPYYSKDGITIYCGDSREILPQLKPVDFIFTDPPYGHNNNNNGDLIHQREAALGRLPSGGAPPVGRPIANDGVEANDLIRLAFVEFKRLLKDNCCCCCCGGGGGPDPQFARWSLWMDEVLNFKQMVVWDKGPIGMGWHYRRSYETVLVAQKGKGKTRWYDTSHKIENIIRHIPKIIPKATDHPTPKPVSLVEHFIRLHTRRKHIVLDPFMGAGTTLVAAKRMGRQAIGVELSSQFCDMAIARLEEAA